MTDQTSPAPPVSVDYLVSTYRALRDKVDELKKEHSAQLKPYYEAMEKIEATTLDYLHATGTESLRTASGTAFIVRKHGYKVQDGHTFFEHVIATQQFDLLERRASKTALDALIENGGALPPGIAVSTEVEVQFRKPTK